MVDRFTLSCYTKNEAIGSWPQKSKLRLYRWLTEMVLLRLVVLQTPKLLLLIVRVLCYLHRGIDGMDDMF